MDVLAMSSNNDGNNSDVVKLACLHSGSGCENIACLTEFCSIIYAPDLNYHNHTPTLLKHWHVHDAARAIAAL